jgi:hypothetical protein
MDLALDSPDVMCPEPQVESTPSMRMRCTRPSLLDPRLPNEPGLGRCVCMPNVVVLYVANRPIAIIQATAMDQVSLDSWLSRVRSRNPRVRLEC